MNTKPAYTKRPDPKDGTLPPLDGRLAVPVTEEAGLSNVPRPEELAERAAHTWEAL